MERRGRQKDVPSASVTENKGSFGFSSGLLYLQNTELFRIFWNVIKPFIDPVTKEKVVFLKTGAAEFFTTFEADQLEPVCVGTKSVDKDRKEYDADDYFGQPLNMAFDEQS